MKAMNHSAISLFCRTIPPYLYGLCLCVLVCLSFPFSSRAALTYNDALARALEREARLQAEEHDAEATRAEGWRSIAGMGPTLTAYAQPTLTGSAGTA